MWRFSESLIIAHVQLPSLSMGNNTFRNPRTSLFVSSSNFHKFDCYHKVQRFLSSIIMRTQFGLGTCFTWILCSVPMRGSAFPNWLGVGLIKFGFRLESTEFVKNRGKQDWTKIYWTHESWMPNKTASRFLLQRVPPHLFPCEIHIYLHFVQLLWLIGTLFNPMVFRVPFVNSGYEFKS